MPFLVTFNITAPLLKTLYCIYFENTNHRIKTSIFTLGNKWFDEDIILIMSILLLSKHTVFSHELAIAIKSTEKLLKIDLVSSFKIKKKKKKKKPAS